MSIADELNKLDDLRSRAVLSDAEFARAKQRLLDGPAVSSAAPAGLSAVNRLRRSASDKWLGGICGGLAQATGVESWLWRLIFTVLLLFGGTGLFFYVLLWIFVPAE